MIFVSSYFVTSIFTPKSGKNRFVGFLILLTTMCAQIILSCEILSLFSAINRQNILIMNAIFFIAALTLWIKNEKPLYIPDIKTNLRRIWNALKRDKVLLIMSFGLLFFITVAIILCCLVPVFSFDALTYHLNRSAFWMFQGNLNHFDIADDRNLVMPINSEIMYMWVLVFLKNDIGLGFFSLTGYFACAYSIYNILGYFGFSERRKLWSVLIMSSFASVIVEVSSVETDILIAGMILASITLFLAALKEKRLSLIFFSSLIYAIAMGTKSPAIIAFPAVFILLSFFAHKQYQKECIKPILAFCGLLFLNFIIFSSYNYILNFIAYQDFLGSESAKTIHSFRGGIKAVVANYIRYVFMLFDFSGFRYSEYVGEHITNVKLALFDFLHIPQELGVEMTDENKINNRLLEVRMGTGLFGFLLFLPSAIVALILAVIKKISKKHSKKITVLSVFAAMFFINLFCLSFSIAYMIFSIRFVTTMVIISSPVLALSYLKKNSLIKMLILFFSMSYFLVMSTNITSRPIMLIRKIYKEMKSANAAREHIRCSASVGYKGKISFCYLKDIMQTTPKGTKFAIIPNYNSRLYVIKMLENQGYKIDVLMAEKIESYDISKYDFIITTDSAIISTNISTKTKDIKLKEIKTNKNGEPTLGYLKNIECHYINHETGELLQKTEPKQYASHSMCFIPNAYFEKNGFVNYGNWNFKSDLPFESNIMTIYRNTSDRHVH